MKIEQDIETVLDIEQILQVMVPLQTWLESHHSASIGVVAQSKCHTGDQCDFSKAVELISCHFGRFFPIDVHKGDEQLTTLVRD